MKRFTAISSLPSSLAAVIAAFLITSFATPAAAQDDGVAQSARVRGTLDEVVTRSRKRAGAERAQDVPIAGTFITENSIALNQYTNFLEIGRMVPTSNFRETSTFPGVQRYFLRGVGVSFSVPNFDPVVAVIADGVYVAQNHASILDTFDLESVEILRGPQGTLFGRNVVGGAIVARSRRPGDELEIRANATIGRFNRADFAFSVSGPVIEDKVGAKLAVIVRNSGGYVRNNLSLDGKNLGSRERIIVRPTITFTPSDNFEFTLLGEYFSLKGDGAVTQSLPEGINKAFPAGNPFLPEGRAWRETWAEQDRIPSISDHDNWRLTGEAIWELDHGVITSITGYMSVDVISGSEFDGLPPPTNIAETRLYTDQDQFSQELRYASTFSEVFDFTIGAYFFTQDLFYGEQRAAGRFVSVNNADPVLDNPDGLRPPGLSILDHKSWSVFVEGHYNMSDHIVITLGGRYTYEKKVASIGFVNFGSCDSSGEGDAGFKIFECTRGLMNGFDIQDQESWKNFAPKVGIDFRVNDDILVYASWTRGFRSGGFIFRASPNDLLFSPRPAFYNREKVESFEIGLKSDLFDDRLRFNTAVFYGLWDDIQRNLQFGTDAGNIFQTTLNADDSYVWGIEVEINYIVGTDMMSEGDSLRFDGSFGWFDSKHTSFVDFNGDLMDDRDIPFVAPDTTFYMGLTYEHPLGNSGGYLSWRVSYNYTSRYGFNAGNNPVSIYRAKDIVDAFIRFDSADESWHISIFGKNILDDQYYESRVAFGSTFGIGYIGMPATWGVEAGVSF